MTNHLLPWNALAKSGNLTRSLEVNDLIKRMRKKEVRKKGVQSQTCQSIKPVEFVNVLEIMMST